MTMRCLWLAAATALAALWALTATAATVTFVHLNDIYEIQPIEGGKFGGAARVATEIARLRRSAAPVIVTLGGDYLSPSALGTAKVEGQPLAGRQMVDVLNAVGVEWATFGNHEFDVSETAFRRHLDQAKFRLISSNVVAADGKPFPNVATSAVVPVKAGKRNLRIGLIGVTVDATAKPWVGYRDAIVAAREEIGKLKGRVDAIVALTHLTLAQDAEFVAALPEVDLVLGGHEHENWLARRGSRLVPIVKADANVRSLAVVNLDFGARGRRPTAEIRLLSIDDSIPANPAVAALADRWTNTGFAGFRQEGFSPESVIVNSNEALDGRESVVRNRPGRLTDLIAASMAHEAAPVDVALFNAGSVRIDDMLPAGPITEYDIIRVLPFGGKVVAVTMEGALLVRVLDMGHNNQGLGGYLHAYGAEHRGDGWLVGGKPLDPAARYRIALNDFLLSGGEVNMGFLTRNHPQLSDLREHRDIRRAVIEELKATYR
jgi:5'-nucleotidase / UDP-sugar diphosphatase